MKIKKTWKTCPKCGGCGEIEDRSAIGPSMRKARLRAGKSLRCVAKAMDVTPPHLSDLELSRRNWTDDMISKFLLAIKA